MKDPTMVRRALALVDSLAVCGDYPLGVGIVQLLSNLPDGVLLRWTVGGRDFSCTQSETADACHNLIVSVTQECNGPVHTASAVPAQQ